MAKLRMAHASTHGARKPPGPIIDFIVIGQHRYFQHCDWQTSLDRLKKSQTKYLDYNCDKKERIF